MVIVTIDERLDRLTERHEALTQGAELLLVETRELRALADRDGENIRALARIGEMHERRLTGLEGGKQ
jgi:hypothetical protein